jgi:hypothetical protein
MRRATGSDSAGNPRGGQDEASRAAERLQDARNAMRGLRRQQTSDQLSDIVSSADKLADEQKQFAEKLRRAYGEAGAPPNRQGAEQLAAERQRIGEQYNELEREMQDASKQLASTQRAASSKLREALGDLQKDEVGSRVKDGAEWIRRGYGAYVSQREAAVTAGLGRLRDQVHDAQRALTPGDEHDNQLERAIAQVEKLRSQMERKTQGAARGQQQGARPQGGQPGSREWQTGQLQRGNSPGSNSQGQGKPGQGQQGQGQQGQGQQGSPGSQSGDEPTGGQSGGNGPGGERYGARSAGSERVGFGGQAGADGTPEGFDRTYRDGIRDLSQLRGLLAGDPELSRGVQGLLREMQGVDPARFAGDRDLLERIQGQLLPGVEELELQLRRKLEEKQGEGARSGSNEKTPEGYGDAVAEYFRRLSRSR